MPYKVHEPRRHKIPRARYKVRNWPEYDRALQQRLTFLAFWWVPIGRRPNLEALMNSLTPAEL